MYHVCINYVYVLYTIYIPCIVDLVYRLLTYTYILFVFATCVTYVTTILESGNLMVISVAWFRGALGPMVTHQCGS